MLENGIAVADREQRGSFPSLVSPVRRLLGGFVYNNEGHPLGCVPLLPGTLADDVGKADTRSPAGLPCGVAKCRCPIHNTALQQC